MKMILAFIPPHRLDRVRRGLEHVDGFPGMTVSRAEGFGHEKLTESRQTRDQLEDFTPTARIECIVQDDMIEEVLAAVTEATHTGSRGDGKIFVFPVSEGLRVKTQERGPDVV